MIRRSYSAAFTASEKTTFLQGWLCFGVLVQVEGICDVPIEGDEFLLDGGTRMSTERLKGLAERWFRGFGNHGRLRDDGVMEEILEVTRMLR